MLSSVFLNGRETICIPVNRRLFINKFAAISVNIYVKKNIVKNVIKNKIDEFLLFYPGMLAVSDLEF